jgi:predicted YcjX-like family ATPase
VANHDQVVKGDDGAALFRVRRQVNSVALILPLERGSECLQDIQDAVADILQEESAVTHNEDDTRTERPLRAFI